MLTRWGADPLPAWPSLSWDRVDCSWAIFSASILQECAALLSSFLLVPPFFLKSYSWMSLHPLPCWDHLHFVALISYVLKTQIYISNLPPLNSEFSDCLFDALLWHLISTSILTNVSQTVPGFVRALLLVLWRRATPSLYLTADTDFPNWRTTKEEHCSLVKTQCLQLGVHQYFHPESVGLYLPDWLTLNLPVN